MAKIFVFYAFVNILKNARIKREIISIRNQINRYNLFLYRQTSIILFVIHLYLLLLYVIIIIIFINIIIM